MNEKFAKGFVVGCISGVSSFLLWEYYLLKKNEKKEVMSGTSINFTTDSGELNVEAAGVILEQMLLPTIIAAHQVGMSPEMFENQINASFGIMGTIMISLYQDSQNEDLTFDQFEEKVKSEIAFLLINAKNPDID